MVARAYGPVWDGIPKNSQAAEFCAYAAATQFLDGPTNLHIDCASVVQAASQTVRLALEKGGPHAGLVKETLKWPGARQIQSVNKVKAHQCDLGEEHKISDPDLRRHALGNNLVDEAAEKGRAAHPALSGAERLQAERYICDLDKIAMSIAAATALCSPLQRVQR